TNSATIFEGNQTLADVLGERDVLLKRCTAYRHLAQMASITQNVYSKSEVKFVSTVNVGDVQKRADELSKAYRELDCRIQELNWKTELLN
ncbi:MAG TPA: DIP1984 family protein, partial [Acidobacteriota bacterium]|nr:DIP1984 family protein [Acidobacteriota bacterium]